MASKITIQCPACLAKLSLPDSSKLGKKIKCPKCQDIFLASSPGEDQDEVEEDDEPKSSPGRKRAGSAAKGSGKKSAKGGSSGGGSNAPLIIGGIVGVVVLVGAGLFFSGIFNKKPAPVASAPVQAPPVVAAAVVQPLTSAEKVMGLRWMPADTGIIIHLKIADLWQTPLLKEPLGNPLLAGSVQGFEQQIGLPLSEIEGVSIGIPDFLAAMLQFKHQNDTDAGKGIPNVSANAIYDFLLARGYFRYVAVVHTKQPVNLNLMASKIPNAKLEKSGDKSFVNLDASFPLVASGAFSPSPNTLIIASSKELKTAMDRGENAASRKEFSLIEPSPQMIFASLIRSYRKDGEALRMEMPPMLIEATKANEVYGLQMVGIGLSLKGGFDARYLTHIESAEARKKFIAYSESSLVDTRKNLDELKNVLPPLFGDLGQMLLTNIKIEEGSQGVNISTGIPGSEQAKLDQLPMTLTMMAMTGGFNTFGQSAPAAEPSINASVGDSTMAKEPRATVQTKQPGETEAAESAKVEGLPEGLKLSARSAWTRYPIKLADGITAYEIEILLDASGEGLETICGATAIAPKTMTIEGGSLKKSKVADSDHQKAFMTFDASDDAAFDHPPQTLRVKVAVDVPAANATKIDVLEGTFKYLTSDGSQELSIDEAPKKVKRVLAGPEFKAMEIRFRRGSTGTTPESYILSCGKDHFLGRAKGTPGDVVSYTDFDKDQVIQRIHSNHEGGKFPEEFQITLKVYPNVKEHSVSFRFENVPLPTAESKPK